MIQPPKVEAYNPRCTTLQTFEETFILQLIIFIHAGKRIELEQGDEGVQKT